GQQLCQPHHLALVSHDEVGELAEFSLSGHRARLVSLLLSGLNVPDAAAIRQVLHVAGDSGSVPGRPTALVRLCRTQPQTLSLSCRASVAAADLAVGRINERLKLLGLVVRRARLKSALGRVEGELFLKKMQNGETNSGTER